jgi:hypothetical protein
MESVALAHAKAIAHAPVTAFTAVYALGDGPIDEGVTANLRALLGESLRLERTVMTADDPAYGARLCAVSTSVLTPTVALVRRLLSQGRGDIASLDALGKEVAQGLRDCTELATEMQLSALHACVTEHVRGLSSQERDTLQVVVAGDHQARARSLAMQYFEKLLGEAHGSELRLAYGEGMASVEDALDLVGTKRVDAALAQTFFRDPRRLQRDVLGDAARAQLARLELPQI